MAPSSTVPVKGRQSWFRWCLRWLVRSIVGLALLIVLFYLEEDWRGARAWSQAQAEIKAQGISLDPQTYIPPPIPDAENFGVAPFFKAEKVDGYLTLAIEKDLKPVASHIPSSKDSGAETGSLPYLGNWYKGESPDLPAIQTQMEDFCRKQIPEMIIPVNTKLADIFGLLCPVLADMRSANAVRPLCRFDLDYNIQPPFDLQLGSTTEQIKVAKVLSYEERLALFGNQTDLAMDDLKVAWKIESGLRQEPFLVSGLVSVGVVAIQFGVVNEGLAKHCWNDRQLTALDDDLGKMDYLTESQNVIRGDTVVFMVPLSGYIKSHRLVMMNALLMRGTLLEHEASWSDYFLEVLFWLIPNGWTDRYVADCTKFNLLETIRITDPSAHRVFPEQETAAFQTLDNSWTTSWWTNYVSALVKPMFNSVKKFAYMQVQIDEARIACRLERYYLTHGSYPNSLDLLTPAYGSELPHDVMNGEPYHYKLNADGTYILYSVGWDQKDDGGQLGAKSPYHNTDNLDWIWTNYPDLVKK